MHQDPKSGPGMSISCTVAEQGRVRPEDVMRRKLIQKMIARRERRAAGTASTRRAAF
jgi:hypothetical protein